MSSVPGRQHYRFQPTHPLSVVLGNMLPLCAVDNVPMLKPARGKNQTSPSPPSMVLYEGCIVPLFPVDKQKSDSKPLGMRPGHMCLPQPRWPDLTLCGLVFKPSGLSSEPGKLKEPCSPPFPSWRWTECGSPPNPPMEPMLAALSGAKINMLGQVTPISTRDLPATGHSVPSRLQWQETTLPCWHICWQN